MERTGTAPLTAAGRPTFRQVMTRAQMNSWQPGDAYHLLEDGPRGEDSGCVATRFPAFEPDAQDKPKPAYMAEGLTRACLPWMLPRSGHGLFPTSVVNGT